VNVWWRVRVVSRWEKASKDTIFIVVLCVCLVPRLYTIYFILLWHDIACLC